VSKKHKPGTAHPPYTQDVKARIERTRREGRYQQALDLVKQLHRAEPTAENLELLKDTYVRRAAQLRDTGHNRDAAIVLEVASRLDEHDLVWVRRLAGEMALCGDVARTLALLERGKQLAGDGATSAPEAAVLAALADASFVNEKAGRDALPADLRADHERIAQAFREAEAGRDDAAREALQGVGLKSPFLGWKLLLRGLQAYYQHDDDRARENWARLDPKRVPARLAAPFRASIDPAYRDAQPAATRQVLQQQLEWMRGGPFDSQLRALQTGMANRDTLGPAFRAAEALLPLLREQAPQYIPRLASCLYWSIPRYTPDELPRYKRVFGPPPDDSDFARLNAIALEGGGHLDEAHEYWKKYEKFIASRPDLWPGEQCALARALVWQRMGDNAASIPTEAQRKKLPRFLRELRAFPKPLNPPAEKCYEKSLELAPKLLDAHEGLFHHLLNAEKDAAAVKAAERLLGLFPDHVETLRDLARLHARRGKHDEARRALEQALRHHPLDRKLREELGAAHLAVARQLVEKGNFDEARPHYHAGLTYSEPEAHASIYCRWAACEIKAGDQAKADELLEQARAKAPGELLVTYNLLVETVRLKLGNPLKSRLTREFNKGITAAPTPALALALVRYAAELRQANVEYHGQQAHTKKIITFAAAVDPAQYGEAQLVPLLAGLTFLEAGARVMRRLFDFAQRTYSDNPRVFYLDAVYQMGDNPEEIGPTWRIDQLLRQAEELGHRRPADEPGLKEMLDDVRRRRRMLQALNPFMAGLADLFARGGGIDDVLEELGEFGMDEDDFDDEDDWM
jgi:tetratricopeptide (TPR) repeat protein